MILLSLEPSASGNVNVLTTKPPSRANLDLIIDFRISGPLWLAPVARLYGYGQYNERLDASHI